MAGNTNEVHINQALTFYSQQLRNNALVADEVLPPVKVNKRSDEFFVYDKDDRFTPPDDTQDPDGEAHEVKFKVGTDNFSVKDKSLQGFVPKAEIDNADDPLRPREDEVEFLTDLLLLSKEKRVADLVTDINQYPNDSDHRTDLAAKKWDDATNGNPLNDILDAMEKIFPTPTVLVMGSQVWKAVRQHPKIVDAINGATRQQPAKGGIATIQQFAELFGLRKVVVGSSRVNGSKKGQTAVLGRVWGKTAQLLYIPERLGPKTITWGCQFKETMFTVMEWDIPGRGSKGGKMIKVLHNEDLKVKASFVGHHFANAVT